MPISASSGLDSRVIVAVATAPERRTIEHATSHIGGVTLLQTGVGPVQVQLMAQSIGRAKPVGLISLGTAGGLAAGLPPGQLLLPRQVSTQDGPVYRVAHAWHTRVCRQFNGHEIETGSMLSVDRPAHGVLDKQELHARTGAVTVDMESAELARIAADLSIPFLIVRAVADPHDQPLPRSAAAALTARGELNTFGLLRQLLVRPTDIPGLLRLNTNFRAAGRTLRNCWRVAGEQICSPNR